MSEKNMQMHLFRLSMGQKLELARKEELRKEGIGGLVQRNRYSSHLKYS